MAEIEVGAAEAGGVVEARPGDGVTVRLPETPTSGYRWEVDPAAPAAVRPEADEYVPGDAAIGGGGTRVFRFRAGDPGDRSIRLVRRRSWEPLDQAAEAFEVTVRVT